MDPFLEPTLNVSDSANLSNYMSLAAVPPHIQAQFRKLPTEACVFQVPLSV